MVFIMLYLPDVYPCIILLICMDYSHRRTRITILLLWNYILITWYERVTCILSVRFWFPKTRFFLYLGSTFIFGSAFNFYGRLNRFQALCFTIQVGTLNTLYDQNITNGFFLIDSFTVNSQLDS